LNPPSGGSAGARTNTKPGAKNPPDGTGCKDFVAIFKWLRDTGVKRILEIIVDDMGDHPHSDEAIEEAVKGFDVEEWNWKRHDICSQTILRAAQKVRKLHLYSSGNNAVLRSWSGEDGLKGLNYVSSLCLPACQKSGY
jgi:hypothetical protein